MSERIEAQDIFGFVRSSLDAHTLGISYAGQLLKDCGYQVHIADARVCSAVARISQLNNVDVLVRWILDARISCLGFSYRLDPKQAAENFGRLVYQLRQRALIGESGQLRRLYFAGLPDACRLVRREHQPIVTTFSGEETPTDTLLRLGIPEYRIPRQVRAGSEYDDWRLEFGRDLIQSQEYLAVAPPRRSGYKTFGTRDDSVVERHLHSRKTNQPPLIRVHVGPYQENRLEAIRQFMEWTRDLAKSGFLDILSIGTSQLTQAKFGENWNDMPNGGGVPINSLVEYAQVWKAARPMLVRTYAGTTDVPRLARIHEDSLNIAWHALSFWWFCRIDGRGSNGVYENLREHLETLEFVAKSGKPFEPNIPHHFAFRGSDDVSFVVSAVLAAKAAKLRGVTCMVLQIMLNTPKQTWGIQDLAKARALLTLIRELEGPDFRVLLQPRAGLDYFSPNLSKAKAQLAAVTALMDDIDPGDSRSPDIIHVVSFSEASHLADPATINESIQITLGALAKYRALRIRGMTPNVADSREVKERTERLYRDARQLLTMVEESVANTYSPEGLYKIFAAGFMPVPYLWEGRNEFCGAVDWTTRIVDGGVKVVGDNGEPMDINDRLALAAANLQKVRLPLTKATAIR